jgi:hypothetical protein
VSGSTWKIYLLRDPRDLSARYVGATVKTLDKRLAAHVYSASRPYNKAPRFVWIRELVDLGLTPSIEMLEHVPEGESLRRLREDWWINALRKSGADLLNRKKGGGGQELGGRHKKRWSSEVRQQQSERIKRAIREGRYSPTPPRITAETHPDVIARRGESIRQALAAKKKATQ